MRSRSAAAFGGILVATVTPPLAAAPNAYPPARRADAVDSIHGTPVPDPYRWLEDADSKETRAWIDAQNRLSEAHLAGLPQRQALHERLERLWRYERRSPPVREGGTYFFTRHDGVANQPVLCVAESLDAPPRVLLDPNALATDGTVALVGWSVRKDGTLLAYGLQSGGSDWTEWRVRDVATGADREDVIRWSKFSGAAWLPDGSGFFYGRYDEPKAGERLAGANYFQKLYLHRLGQPQSADTVVLSRPDQKSWGFAPTVTDDGRYLVVSVWAGTGPKNLVWIRDLATPDAPFRELVSTWESQFTYLDNAGPILFFQTNSGAPRERVVAADLRLPDPVRWFEVVPERPETLVSSSIVAGALVCNYLRDAHSFVRVHSAPGEALAAAPFIREVELPGLGTASGFSGRRGDPEACFLFDSFVSPPTVFRLLPRAGAPRVWFRPAVDFEFDEYVTEQVFFTSRDGTRVPMFLTHRKGATPAGTARTYLYGYGGFNISITPAFSPAAACWLERGGLWAVANIRGGGEYGEEWHRAATRAKKQNCFDDFIGAAEHLVRERWTVPSRIGIAGRSNGGLLVGAVLNQRPELFGAALPSVGVMDMLRFHKFTIGWAWVDDYGSAEDAGEFAALRAYSPLHNIRSGGRYPAVLVSTADHDDRVVPAHSFKYAAALQAAQAGDAPILIRVETKAGHGAGKPLGMVVGEIADKWAFLLHHLR